MKVTDLYGEEIEVTDLSAAIRQTNMMMQFSVSGKQYERFNRERRTYWQDLNEKLLQLRSDVRKKANEEFKPR